MKQLNELSNLLDQLTSQAIQRDQQYGDCHQPLFDQSLFHCQSAQLYPYVEEAKQTFDKLTTQIKLPPNHPQVGYLSEKLICQIDALNKELASFDVRQQESRQRPTKRNGLGQLYQNLAQHQVWESQLKAIVTQSEQIYSQAISKDKGFALQKLETARRRLQRCQQAKIRIEKHITYKERNQ